MAEDHQTKNARALADHDAAILIPDDRARQTLVDTAIETIQDPKKLAEMSANAAKLALTESDDKIVDEVIKILNRK